MFLGWLVRILLYFIRAMGEHAVVGVFAVSVFIVLADACFVVVGKSHVVQNVLVFELVHLRHC